jgi:DNA-binding CsgD family transcriptional regulator/tetratricopeptide (TPR) repeat protein
MTSRVTSARVVGRERELSELELALGDAAGGRPSLVFVAGESGVGKSRLLSEAQRRMRAAGARVLWGDCFDLGDGELPYAPLVAALRPLAREGDPALDALPGDLREELAAFLPGPSGAAAGSSQGRLFEALLALLDALAEREPLVLLVEDLHWADRSTRAFLTFLSRSLCAQRLLVVASYRPDELHRRHPLRPLLAELEREPRARRIELGAFTRAELAEQLADILGAAPPAGLVERLWVRSEGNALFTEELLASGLDGRGGLPPTLRDALMVRIERLPPDAQEVVRLLAAGRRLPHEVLADAGELAPAALRDALREAVASHLLTADADGSYAFRHALLREVVADDLLPGEQAHLHLALARALERKAEREGGTGAHLAAGIAEHYYAAGDQPAALVAAIRAADAAERIHAEGEAAALLERALELWHRVPDAEALVGGDEAALLLRAAHAHNAQDEPHRVIALLERGLALVEEGAAPHRAAALLERLAQAQWNLNRQEEAMATGERALALLDAEGPSVARASLLAWWSKRLMLMGRYRRAVGVAQEAIAQARAVGDPLSESRASNALGVAWMALAETEDGIAALERSMTIARAADLPSELGTGYVNLADALHLAGRTDEAIAMSRRGLDELADHGPNTWMQFGLAEFLLDAGRLDEAASAIGTEERRPHGTAVLCQGIVHVGLALHRGEHDQARRRLEAMRPHAETTVESQFSGIYGAMLAELKLRDGDLDGARTAAAEALERIVTCTDDVARVARVAATGVLVEAAAAQRARDLGDAAAADAAAGQAAVLLAYVASAAGRPVEDALALQGAAALARARGHDDPVAWDRSAAAWEAIGRPLAAGADRLRAAEAWMAAGERDCARDRASAVVAMASTGGATWLEEQARSLAARGRLRLVQEADEAVAVAAPAGAGAPFGLTPREQQVLALLAEGATNRQIGDALFMAEKTASVHVSRILAKLDVRSRTQAAAVAHRLGLGLEPVPS